MKSRRKLQLDEDFPLIGDNYLTYRKGEFDIEDIKEVDIDLHQFDTPQRSRKLFDNISKLQEEFVRYMSFIRNDKREFSGYVPNGLIGWEIRKLLLFATEYFKLTMNNGSSLPFDKK